MKYVCRYFLAQTSHDCTLNLFPGSGIYTLDPVKIKDRKERQYANTKACGTTCKTDEQIWNFNEEWKAQNKEYLAPTTNCIKYAYECVQWACGASSTLKLPVTQKGTWEAEAGSHLVLEIGDHHSYRETES